MGIAALSIVMFPPLLIASVLSCMALGCCCCSRQVSCKSALALSKGNSIKNSLVSHVWWRCVWWFSTSHCPWLMWYVQGEWPYCSWSEYSFYILFFCDKHCSVVLKYDDGKTSQYSGFMDNLRPYLLTPPPRSMGTSYYMLWSIIPSCYPMLDQVLSVTHPSMVAPFHLLWGIIPVCYPNTWWGSHLSQRSHNISLLPFYLGHHLTSPGVSSCPSAVWSEASSQISILSSCFTGGLIFIPTYSLACAREVKLYPINFHLLLDYISGKMNNVPKYSKFAGTYTDKLPLGLYDGIW